MKEIAEQQKLTYRKQISNLLKLGCSKEDLEPVAVFWESPIIHNFVEHHYAWFETAREAMIYAELKEMQLKDYGMKYHIVTSDGVLNGGLMDL